MADEANKYLCKYRVASLVFMLEDEKLELDASNLLSIEYLCDYEMNIRAILKLNLRLDIRRRLWILKNKRDIVCKFELCQIGVDTEEENYNTNTGVVWNEEFGVYLTDDEESIDVKVLAERLQMNDLSGTDINHIETENYFEAQNIMEIYLFNQKLLNASNATYNEILTKDVLQNFVARLLTQTKHKKVLMSPFENDEVYEELLVPALPAYKALSYLDQYYGFYKKGSIIFYDIDCLYILNANGEVTAKRENEWTKTTVLVTRIDNSTPGNGMILRDGEKISYISLPDENVNPRKFTIISNESLGSEAKLVITDDVTIDNEEADQSYIEQRNQTIIQQHKDDNKYSAKMLKARMEEVEKVLYLTGENMDIRAFTPNREFTAVFDEPTKQEKYGVEGYRVAYAYHCIRIEGEGHLSAAHQIILKRKASDDDGE